jgi:hypothetical protein
MNALYSLNVRALYSLGLMLKARQNSAILLADSSLILFFLRHPLPFQELALKLPS